MPTIITASGINTASNCIGGAVSKCFGSRKNWDSDLRDALKANNHLYTSPFRKFSATACVGTACHKGAEVLLKEKASGYTPSLSASKDSVIQELRGQELDFDDDTRNINEAENKALKMVSIFHKVLMPSIDPKTVESRLSMEINGFVFTGQTDVVEHDGTIYDHKFGKSSAISYLVQMGFNSMLESDVGGVLKIGKVDPKKFTTEIYEFKKENAELLAKKLISRVINQVNEYLESGNPDSFDFNPGNWLCSEKYCPAFGKKFCRYTYNGGSK